MIGGRHGGRRGSSTVVAMVAVLIGVVVGALSCAADAARAAGSPASGATMDLVSLDDAHLHPGRSLDDAAGHERHDRPGDVRRGHAGHGDAGCLVEVNLVTPLVVPTPTVDPIAAERPIAPCDAGGAPEPPVPRSF